MTATPNTSPSTHDQAIAAYIDTPKDIALEANDSEGDSLRYFIVQGPSYGMLSGVPPIVTYTPNTGFKGKDSFTFRVNDGQADSNIATVTTYVWTQPQRLDSTGGAEPTLSYAPNGDLRVFYNIGDTTNNHMVVRTRLNAQTVFGLETFVYDDAHTAAVHYDTSGKLDLAVNTDDYITILQSLNGGNTWDLIKTYPNRNFPPVDSKDLRLCFTQDNSATLRLFYNYVNSAMITTFCVQTVKRINNVWEGNPLGLGCNQYNVFVGAHENGDKVTAFSYGAVFHSQNNGATYNLIRFDGLNLSWAQDIAVDSAGRMYYVFPSSNNISLRYSDDNGTTWSGRHAIVQCPNGVKNLRLAIDGDRMVVVWQISDFPQHLQCIVSEDGGESWSNIMPLVSLAEPNQLVVNDLESYGGRFTLGYSVLRGQAREGTYLMEFSF